MSNLAKSLLSQYYGLGEESNVKKFVFVHQSIEMVKSDEERLTAEGTSTTTNEENPSEEEPQQDNNDGDKSCVINEPYRRSSRVLSDIDEPYDTDENSDIDPGPNILCYAFENAQTSTGKEKQWENVLSCNIKTALDTLDAEDTEGNDASLTFIEDTLRDSVSDISSVVTSKKLQKSLKTSSPVSSVSKKEPTCNDIFIDLSSTGLKTFPVEMLTEFAKLRMLYLENNNLTDLPNELFTSLQHLEWLDVRDNHLTTIPTNIKFHSSLHTLLLEGNEIETLPLELCLVPKLQILHVTRNPLILPPKDIVSLGCTGILNFLRLEWNKLYPEEQVKHEEITILQTVMFMARNEYTIYYTNIQNNLCIFIKLGTSVEYRKLKDLYSFIDKTSRLRCNKSGTNISRENRLVWMSKLKEINSNEASILQKKKDETVLKEWRRDKRSFSKAMKKAIKRNEDDIPFAIDIDDYSSIFNQNPKLEKRLKHKNEERLKFTSPVNINKKICELLESLNKLQVARDLDNLTPRSEQKFIRNEIGKILRYQEEIQNLRKYNNII